MCGSASKMPLNFLQRLARLTLIRSVPIQKPVTAGSVCAQLANPTAPGPAPTYNLTTATAGLVEHLCVSQCIELWLCAHGFGQCGGGKTCQSGTCAMPPWPTDFGPDTCNNVPSTIAPGQYQAKFDGFNCYCLRPGTQPSIPLCPTDPNGQAGCTQTCTASEYDSSPGGGCGFAGSTCYIQCNSGKTFQQT